MIYLHQFLPFRENFWIYIIMYNCHCSLIIQGLFFYGSFLLFMSFVMLSRLVIAALWSSSGKGLTSWLMFVRGKQLFYYMMHITDVFPSILIIESYVVTARSCRIAWCYGVSSWKPSDIIQLLTIEAFEIMCCRPENTNIDRGGASHQVQWLNSQQLLCYI